jgi:hypothetical protein
MGFPHGESMPDIPMTMVEEKEGGIPGGVIRTLPAVGQKLTPSAGPAYLMLSYPA